MTAPGDESGSYKPTRSHAASDSHPLTERRKLRIEVDRLKPMAELGRMAATVTHEIRNPLAGISANAELLRESLSDPRDIELVDTILGEVHRLGNLVTDLLYYCRERPADNKQIDLAALARATCDLSRPDAERLGVRLAWSGTGTGLGDNDLSRQALLNLIRNAVQACPRGGAVHVQVEPGRIIVRDTGKGIPPEVAGQLFQPFVTGKTRGLGLGLTVAKRCQMRQDGDVVLVETGPGGSTFAMTWVPSPG